MARILRGAPARARAIMASGGRLPCAAGRPPRFLRTGSSACYRPQRGASPGRAEGRQTHARDSGRGCPSIAFGPSGIAGPASAKVGIPRTGRGRLRRRRGALPRGGLLATEVADPAPATALTRGAVLRDAAAPPRLSTTAASGAVGQAEIVATWHEERAQLRPPWDRREIPPGSSWRCLQTTSQPANVRWCFHAQAAARCLREAVVRRPTSTSRGSVRASSGRCSREPRGSRLLSAWRSARLAVPLVTTPFALAPVSAVLAGRPQSLPYASTFTTTASRLSRHPGSRQSATGAPAGEPHVTTGGAVVTRLANGRCLATRGSRRAFTSARVQERGVVAGCVPN